MKRSQEIRILIQDYCTREEAKKAPRQRNYRTFKKSF